MIKHARVREACLRLQRVRGRLWLTVSDQGPGFETPTLGRTAGFGLLDIRVIALSMFDEPETAERMRRAGATAYLLKTGPSEDLLAAIRGRPKP